MLAVVTTWWRQFSDSRRGKATLRILRGLLLAGILGFLVYKLTEIGWAPVWEHLPTQPLFYLFFGLLYFLLPLTELLIYRITWRYDLRHALPAFVKKRIYNREVLAYSGEVFFVTWARKHVGLPARAVAETVRDNNIISSAASTTIALVLLGIFLYVGHLRITDLIGNRGLSYVGSGVALVVVLAILGLRFRKYLFSMAARTALLIFAVQCLRLILGQALQIAQWAVVMPDVSLSVWFTFAAVSIILTRIPFLPNQSLVFMSVGVELSSSLGIPEAAMFSMLGVLVALDKLVSFGLFTYLTLAERGKKRLVPVGVEDPAPVPAPVQVEMAPTDVPVAVEP